jgi:hypothetical protein
MHFDGSNGSTTFTDVYGVVAPTATGTATISTAQSKFGGASLGLAASAYISGTPSSAALNFGSGEFAGECWVYLTATPSGYVNAFSFQPGSGRPALNLGVDSGGHIFAYLSDASSGTLYTTSNSVGLNAWHALSIARKSGTLYLFVDGSGGSVGSGSSQSLNLNGVLFSAGSNTAVGGTAGPAMYVDELRVSKVGLYTSNYTPASAAFTS